MKEIVLDCDFLILNRIPELYSARRFQEEIDRHKWKGHLISPESLKDWASQFESQSHSQNHGLGKKPTVLYRQGEYNFWETQKLMEELNFPIINSPDAFLNARDKWKTYQHWKTIGIPTPETVLLSEFGFTSRLEQYKFFNNKFGSPFILKMRFSSQGRGVFLIDDFPSYEAVFWEQSLISPEHWLVQKAVMDSLGSDVRNFVLGDTCYSILRENKNHFLSNLHQGGRPYASTLNTLERQLCDKVKLESKLSYAGVDFLRSQQGPLFLEINASPGFKGIEEIYDVNIAEDIIRELLLPQS